MVWSGLSEVIGSWKIIETRLPRIWRSLREDAPITSVPSTSMVPLGCEATG